MSSQSSKNCPRLFYSSSLFVWPYGDEVQITTFADQVQMVWPSDCQSKMESLKLEACSEQECFVKDLMNFERTQMSLKSCETYNVFLKPISSPYKNVEALWKTEISTLPNFQMDIVTGYDHIKIILDQVRKMQVCAYFFHEQSRKGRKNSCRVINA